MQQHIYYIKAAIKRIQRKLAFFVERKQARPQAKYALRFADMQIQELVTTFNSQVQNRGWSSMRAYHDQALIDEFQRRGINVSVVSDGKTISFVHPVKYDIEGNSLIVINWYHLLYKNSALDSLLFVWGGDLFIPLA